MRIDKGAGKKRMKKFGKRLFILVFACLLAGSLLFGSGVQPAQAASRMPATVVQNMTDAEASGVKNIVNRAYQQVYIKWKALKTVRGFTENGRVSAVYRAGHTYTGLPYGQLVSSGKYVPFEASFTRFLKATKNANSVFYTTRGKYGTYTSTYYGNDCSAFVSYAYGLPRMTTTEIACSSYFTKVKNNSIYNAQVGDCMNCAGSHVELITNMEYNAAGKLVSIEVAEQTPPNARVVTYTPSQLKSLIKQRGFTLLRYKNRASVKAPVSYSGYNRCGCTTSYAGRYTCTRKSGLPIRSGHGKGFAAVGTIPCGATVRVKKANGSWAHVTYKNTSGYISMRWLKKKS